MLAGKSSLLSIPQFTQKGCLVTMVGSNATIYSNSSERILLLEGIFRGKGYFIKKGLCDQTMHLAKLISRHISPARSILVSTPMLVEFHELAMMAGVEDTQPLEVWHVRLGYLNQSAI